MIEVVIHYSNDMQVRTNDGCLVKMKFSGALYVAFIIGLAYNKLR